MKPKRARIPNCTHISMERVHLGRYGRCFVCGQVPSIGFLYECRQDHDPALQPTSEIGQDCDDATKSDLCRDLEEAGLSKSIIAAAEQHKYTDEQLEKLKTLKEEMKQVILDTLQSKHSNETAAKEDNTPSNNDGALNSTPVTVMTGRTCCFRACHTCRPYFKDRIFVSFDAVFANEFKPLTYWDVSLLPTKPAQILRGIGMHTYGTPASDEYTPSTLPTSGRYYESPGTSSRSSTSTFRTTQTDIDYLDSSYRYRRHFYKTGHRSSGDIARDLSRLPIFLRQGLRTAFQGIFRPSRESSSSGSNITLPMSRTGTARHLNDGSSMGEFDMGALRRVRRQKEAIDLRTGMGSDNFEGVYEDAHLSSYAESASACGNQSDSSAESEFTVYSCASEGSEVEVHGGVALTEEAVETHTPDILSSPVSEEGVDREEMESGSIMTQM